MIERKREMKMFSTFYMFSTSKGKGRGEIGDTVGGKSALVMGLDIACNYGQLCTCDRKNHLNYELICTHVFYIK